MPDMRSLLTAVAGQAELVIDSNVTPKIVVNLADILVPGTPSNTAIQSDHPLMMKLIRPEIAVQTIGIEQSFAPFGKPRAGMYAIVGVSVVAAGVFGALLSWAVCKKYI
jgi:hypothetical protein